jgi:exosortase D (VPLPA-CTERM-specific)
MIISLVGPLPLFWYGFTQLTGAWSMPEFRLKAFVPVLSLAMLLQAMRSLPSDSIEPRDRWPGVLIIAAALGLAALGNHSQVAHFLYVAMILYVSGLIITLFGLRTSIAFLTAVGCLVLMLPVPMFLYNFVHGVLFDLTSQMAIWLLWLLGSTASLDGDFIRFGSLSVRLRGATSGLEHLLPLMLVFFFLAAFLRGPLWLRLLPLLLTAPLLVLFSAVRLAATGLVATQQSAATAETMLRLSEGWPFLVAAGTLIFTLVLLAARLSNTSWPERRLDIDTRDMSRQLTRLVSPQRSGALVAAALLAAFAGVVASSAPRPQPPSVEREMLFKFPPEIDGWVGSRVGLPQEIEATLAATDYLAMQFFHTEERASVDFWIAYYAEQNPTARVHSPEACLPGDGWNFVTRDSVTLSLAGSRATELPANKAVIRKGDVTALMLYWFEGRGRRTASDVRARVEDLLDGWVMGRTDGALVRFMTEIASDETEEDAEARLLRLIAATERQLSRFIPH